MQIGKWLYRTKVYFYLIFNYWIFPWRLKYYEIDIDDILTFMESTKNEQVNSKG
jgi:hypothetical protein